MFIAQLSYRRGARFLSHVLAREEHISKYMLMSVFNHGCTILVAGSGSLGRAIPMAAAA